jgi:hypothetical protein
MLGFGSVEAGIAYIMAAAAAVLCTIYGIKKWNEGEGDAKEFHKVKEKGTDFRE